MKVNNKYKIVALFGPAGSGKDYIQKQVTKTIWGKLNLHEIISCTTRPPRENEIDGVHYHFMPTPAELIKQDLIEYTIFRDWWYGTSIHHLSKDKINIGVFNINGIEKILKNEKIDCLPIYIKVFPKIRLLRQLQREINPDCDEIIRRYLTDKEDFSNIPFEYKIIENNYNEIQPVIDDLFYFIRQRHWT